ncbi:hypothetical protein [Mycolicibacterium farcinogenes]|uniref:Uncharacterized protein n=1 Tax=Mycolicibacterium farcinogenes TaxID=1802 RepID=A0ACD1FD46_MYCFR|nr:hypothetical protein [Mycolicibacterium farcinogenes]QZH65004.1 hypothetical protein K6L26_23835 [Mycolicibacterium farcinogenes]
MGTNPYVRARAEAAQLSRHHAPDDPVLVAARQRMHEAFVVHKIGQLLDKPRVPLTADLRARVDALLDEHQTQAAVA